MRNRNMYYMTGLPGWMRFGYSPGWVGRSPSGLGPCAEYLMTGQWPRAQMQMAAQGYSMPPLGMPVQPSMPMGQTPMGAMGCQPPGMDRGAMGPAAAGQLPWLQQQAQMLQQQLDQINAEIERLQQAGQ